MNQDNSNADDRVENISSQRMGKILGAIPFMPSVSLKHADSWKQMGEFAERAGLYGLEVLLRTPHAERGVFQLRENFPNLKVGLGTVLTVGDFRKAIDCKADFVVSPGFLPELLQLAKDSSLAYLPGVMTPSEIMFVSSYGFWNAKLFPAGYLAEPFIKGIEGPYPHMKYCVAGGVSDENWAFFAQQKSVRSISGTWILPQEPLAEVEAQNFIEKLEEKHFQFAKYKSLL